MSEPTAPERASQDAAASELGATLAPQGTGPGSGARRGAALWLAYALMEAAATSLFPWTRLSDPVYTPEHLRGTALLLVLFTVVGMALGAGVGFVVRATVPAPRRAAAEGFGVVLGFVLVWLANLAWERPFARGELLQHAGLAALVLIGSGWSVLAPRPGTGRPRLTGWNACWFAPCVFAGFVFARHDLLVRPSAAMASLAGYAWVGLALLLATLTTRWSLPKPRFVLAPLAVACLVSLGVLEGRSALPPREDAGLPAPRPGPNVVLVTLDTVRADHLSLYGYPRPTSPRLEAFAARATVYERAVASGDSTLPTHAILSTGLYAREHGAHHVGFAPWRTPLSEDFETLAERLGAAGYATYGSVANLAYLGREFGLHQGFQHYDLRWPVRLFRTVEREGRYALRVRFEPLVARWAPAEVRMLNRRAEHVNAAAFAQLEEASASPRPFFLFVNYLDAHGPYLAPAPWDTLFDALPGEWDPERYYSLARRVMRDDEELSADELARLRARYDGCIAYLDSELGKLFERLEDLGLMEDTLVVVTADHGEAFGEHGLVTHGVSVHEDQVRVPLVVRWPGQTEGRREGRVVSLVDVQPTVLELAGLAVPEGAPGASLVGEAAFAPGRSIVAESYPHRSLRQWSERFHRVQRALYRGDWKLVHGAEGTRLFAPGADPAETRDRSAEQETRAGELEAELAAWLARVPDTAELAREGEGLELDDEARAMMEALGYADDE